LLPKPIRVSRDEWVCVRNDPAVPKAIIRRVVLTPPNGGDQVQKYRVVSWALEQADRKLIGYYDDLQHANNAVLYDVPDPESIVKGQDAFGMYKAEAGPRPKRIDSASPQ
jgi:hypothetical protein